MPATASARGILRRIAGIGPALVAVVLAGAASLALPAAAQDFPMSTGTIVGRSTILTLDQDRLYAESAFGKALEKKSADQVAKLAAENRKIESELTAEEKSLTEKRKTMSAADFKPLAEAFNTKVEKIRAEQEAKSKAIQSANEAGRKKFFQAALPILAELMREKGALAILNKSSVILAFDAIDVTDDAIAALNSKLGDGSNLPDSPAPAPAPSTPVTPSISPPAAPALPAPGASGTAPSAPSGATQP